MISYHCPTCGIYAVKEVGNKDDKEPFYCYSCNDSWSKQDIEKQGYYKEIALPYEACPDCETPATLTCKAGKPPHWAYYCPACSQFVTKPKTINPKSE